MIRIFERDGTASEVDAPLLEICSSDGLPAVFILSRDDGAIEVVQSGTPRFNALCQRLGRKPAEIKHLDPL